MKYDVYLAGPCDSEHRSIMVSIAKFLRAKGKNVYCPWELKIENAWDMPQEKWAQAVFDADVAAINDSEMLVIISYGRTSSCGTAWEQGYAYAKGIHTHVIQINDKPTSLMIYCGSNNFVNLDNEYKGMQGELNWICDHGAVDYHGKCRTVLT